MKEVGDGGGGGESIGGLNEEGWGPWGSFGCPGPLLFAKYQTTEATTTMTMIIKKSVM